MGYADLHVHTYYSDSTLSPQEVVKEALKEGLEAMAITDHDEVRAIPLVVQEARGTPLEVIAGMELTTNWENEEIHILGLFIEGFPSPLLEALNELREERLRRMQKMIEKLARLGLKVNIEEVLRIAGLGSVGRPHLAQALADKGLVKSYDDAFRLYLGKDKPAYEKKKAFSLHETLRLIDEARAISVLAHPRLSNVDAHIPTLAKMGIRGLEVYHPKHGSEDVFHYSRLAQTLGLLITGGSDCHGKARGDASIGSVKVPYEMVEELKRARASIQGRKEP